MAGPSNFNPTDKADLYSIKPPSYDSCSTQERTASFETSEDSHDLSDQVLPTGKDGRLTLKLGKNAAQLYHRFQIPIPDSLGTSSSTDTHLDLHDSTIEAEINLPRLNIVLQVVGSRGDVQPFLALAKGLQQSGHRVRLATHPTFRDLVTSYGIEFFSIGGDPAELMAYMVRNPGLMPKFETVRRGEVYRRRRAMREILRGCWRSCYEPTVESATDRAYQPGTKTKSRHVHARVHDPQPFVADVIIANPPSFAHIHCAEKLGIPLYMVFTMPWSPTREFAHPLADIDTSDEDVTLARYLSYFLVDAIIWQGLGSTVNRFRNRVLNLEPINPTLAPGMLHRLRIRHYYCWSPTLIPKPHDWNSSISVPGYFQLTRPSQYSAPKDLQDFLSRGIRPIYIGFGSIVIDDPASLTSVICKAIELAGVRAVIASGWGSLNISERLPESLRDNIFVLNADCPHDYLFQHVSLVVHHGGAGTSAASLSAGRPSIVVPFFGDQFFWGNMAHKAGISPAPLPYLSLNASKLASAIHATLQAPMQVRALELSEQLRKENGVDTAIRSIHADLHRLHVPQCSLFPDRVATWQYTLEGKAVFKGKYKTASKVHLSPLAAAFLRKHDLISSREFDGLSILRFTEHNVASGPFEPVSGAAWAILDLLYDSFKGMGEILTEVGHIPYLGVKAFDRSKAAYRTPSSNGTTRQSDDASEQISPIQSSPAPSSASPTALESHRALPGAFMVKGTLRLGKAAARAPGAFTSAMASGAHNFPLLYNDPTVRPTPVVRGIGSGVKAGVSELALGVYDGIAGLFTQPIMGAINPSPSGSRRQDDAGKLLQGLGNDSSGSGETKLGDRHQWSVGDRAIGFAKGLGRGVVGLPVKWFAAANGIVGYPLKGIDAAVSNAWRRGDIEKEIRGQRALQGEREYYAECFDSNSIREVEKRWLALMESKRGQSAG